MAQTQHGQVPTRFATSVWTDLAVSYNNARMAIAVLATLSSTVVGSINDWPRGPWVPIVSVAVFAHAAYIRYRGARRAIGLLVIDALALAITTFVIDIATVTLLAIAFLMISASVLENGVRIYALWALDVVLLGAATGISRALDLAGYAPEEEALTEIVGLLFFTVAAVGMTRTLVRRLRRSEFKQHAVEQKLSTFDSRYEAMLAHSSDGISVTDAGLRLVELGVQNERITGYGVDERVGGSLLDLVVDEDRSALLEAFQTVVRDPDAVAHFQVRITRRDGEIRRMRAIARNLLSDPDLEGFVFNFTDVTEQHRERTSLEDANQRLKELNRSKDEFIASVSHELRSPLTAVVGMADLLEQSDLDDSDRNEFLAILRTQARQTAAIVEDLLVAARADIGQVSIRSEPCPLVGQIEDVISLIDPATSVSVDVGPDMSVLADATRLHQIFRNLVLNAERHGGDRIEVSAKVSDGVVSVCVTDDGPGVAESESEQIFEPYHRSQAAYSVNGSIGLGLSVSRILARLMGGDLIYRRDGLQTVFELTLIDATASLEADGADLPLQPSRT